LLATVDVSRCSSADCHTVALAEQRQLSYQQARLWRVLLEAGYAQSDDGADPSARVRVLGEFSATRLGFTLTQSRQSVAAQQDLARSLMEKLPVVFAAVVAGRIDPARAKVFKRCLSGLDVEVARRIVDTVIIKAERWTAAQLARELAALAIVANPDLAKERYKFTVEQRRVFLRPYGDGTTHLGGVNLPPHLAAAALDRLTRLARAAKAAGDPRTLNNLRADAFLDLLRGRPFGPQPTTDPLTRDADQDAGDAPSPDGTGVPADPDDEFSAPPSSTLHNRPNGHSTPNPVLHSTPVSKALRTVRSGWQRIRLRPPGPVNRRSAPPAGYSPGRGGGRSTPTSTSAPPSNSTTTRQ